MEKNSKQNSGDPVSPIENYEKGYFPKLNIFGLSSLPHFLQVISG